MNKKQDKVDQKKTRVVIVDDHPVVRDGLAVIINYEPDFNVCGQADDTQQALKVIDEMKPDVVVVDISLKSSNGIELTKIIKARYPEISVIIFSIYDESVYAERALHAGAQAYLMKDAVSEHIVKAIRTVLKGDIYVSNTISMKFLHKIAGNHAGTTKTPIDNLSDRELETLRLIGEGYKTSQIAKRLNLSVKTIETYNARIKEKLDIANSSELLRYSIKWAKSQDGE